MRIVCISDTHNMQGEIKRIPPGDVLIHAGDLTMDGESSEIFEGLSWLSRLPHERIILTAGNHDFGFERVPNLVANLQSKFPRVQILLDDSTILNGARLWASPWQPWFHNWAFNFLPGAAGEEQARNKWATIPDDTAILVTHGPVHGILDSTQSGRHVGDAMLRARIEQLRSLRLFVGGHVHESYGVHRLGEVLYVNASTCDSQYWPSQPPIVVDYDQGRAQHVPFAVWSRET